jgi:CubicO group peptidase (beta-lactamase class C family)
MTSTTSTPEIHGTCPPRYARVREAFAKGFAARGEIGASVAVSVEGEPVVELWAGHADPARTRPWKRDTLVHLYSVTKGMTALCAHRLIEAGLLDLDAPVARYWPEFAAAGKETISVDWLLSHRAGLSALRTLLPPETLYDWDAMCSALAAEAPVLPPGRLGYHPLTYGWLVGELVRRVDGRSVGRYFREEIAAPLGLDLQIGLAPADDARTADITMLEPPPEMAAAFADIGDPAELPLLALAFANPLGTGDHNCTAPRRAEIPAINGHGTAAALARVYGALACGGEVDGVRVLSPEAIARASAVRAEAVDALFGMPLRLGLGFWISQPEVPGLAFGPHEGAFGHPGAGGSLGFADPEARLGFGYVCNRMGSEVVIDARPQALIDALYA